MNLCEETNNNENDVEINSSIDHQFSQNTKTFFSAVAEKIIIDFHPKTVLDAGCGMGYLVAALRDRGVEAYGIDTSDSAVSMAREDIKSYCYVGSLAEELPEKLPVHFDLVTSFDAMERLYAAGGDKAIANLCTLTDTVLFSSTPDDVADSAKTQQREYWCTRFAASGLFDVLSYRPDYISSQAICFQRQENILSQIEAYERDIREKYKELADKDYRIKNLQSQINALATEVDKLRIISEKYEVVSNSASWKITKPFRAALDAIKKLARKVSVVYLVLKGIKHLIRKGPAATFKKTYHVIRKKWKRKHAAMMPPKRELTAQRNTVFSKDVKISILVPLYNTPVNYLRKMIESVTAQTYPNWELCLADGSDDQHTEVAEICQKYIDADKRIVYRKLEKNMGISGNTNACIDMSSGDYIALFDHDDLLHPSALYEVMKAIEQGADFIYTDETTFHDKPSDAFLPHYKPDFAPDTLRANNYICHFTVFEKKLLETAGMFRSECDGSQDYDMVLRLTEQAKKIVHIPKILYFWRAHKNSVAENIGAKPYVIEAAHKALQDHLDRVGLKGEVLNTVVPSMYRIQYELAGTPLVSILIPNMDHVSDLKKCIDSIIEKTSYPNWEIVIIENNSTHSDTFEYYRSIQSSRIRIVRWNGIFNYSAINNFGAKNANGEYLLLLNNDIEIITPDWIQEMLMFAQRPDVGAVGTKLYYPDDTIQHGGVGIGLLTLAGHYHRGFARSHPGYMGRLIYAQNLSAVTAACMMIRRDVWDQIHGLDESFEVAFNDIDMCMRIRKEGYLIVWTPFAEMYHYESKSRGLDDSSGKKLRFQSEVQRFQARWAKELAAGDPYFNPNFDQMHEGFDY